MSAVVENIQRVIQKITMSHRQLYLIQCWIKYLLDRTIAGLTLILLTPFLILAYIMVRIFMGYPAFFTQERVGHRAKAFTCYKFRTMTNARSINGQLLSDEYRLTRFGRLLRRLKIDELPQLWNIFTGDMSFVGPRPTLPDQVSKYDAYSLQRLAVKPGLTGWAQVNGNIQLSWSDRIHLDIWYISHWSIWLDCKILFKTFSVIIWGEHPSEKALEAAKQSLPLEKTDISSNLF